MKKLLLLGTATAILLASSQMWAMDEEKEGEKGLCLYDHWAETVDGDPCWKVTTICSDGTRSTQVMPVIGLSILLKTVEQRPANTVLDKKVQEYGPDDIIEVSAHRENNYLDRKRMVHSSPQTQVGTIPAYLWFMNYHSLLKHSYKTVEESPEGRGYRARLDRARLDCDQVTTY